MSSHTHPEPQPRRHRIHWRFWEPPPPSREEVEGLEHAKAQLRRAQEREPRVEAVVRAQEASRRDNFEDAFVEAFYLRPGRQGHR